MVLGRGVPAPSGLSGAVFPGPSADSGVLPERAWPPGSGQRCPGRRPRHEVGRGHCRSELLVDMNRLGARAAASPQSPQMKAPGEDTPARVRGECQRAWERHLGLRAAGRGSAHSAQTLHCAHRCWCPVAPVAGTHSGRHLAFTAALQGCPGTLGLWGPCCGAAHPSSAPPSPGGSMAPPLQVPPTPSWRQTPNEVASQAWPACHRGPRWAGVVSAHAPCLTGQCVAWPLLLPDWHDPPCPMSPPAKATLTFSVVMSVSASWRFCVKMMLKTAWERLLVSFMFVAATVLGERKPQVLTHHPVVPARWARAWANAPLGSQAALLVVTVPPVGAAGPRCDPQPGLQPATWRAVSGAFLTLQAGQGPPPTCRDLRETPRPGSYLTAHRGLVRQRPQSTTNEVRGRLP